MPIIPVAVARSLAAAALLAAGAVGLSGCAEAVGMASYPPAPTQTVFADPNKPAVFNAIAAGLAAVIDRYPPIAGVAMLNVPIDLTSDRAAELVEDVQALLDQRQGRQAPRVELYTDSGAREPIYHLSRVWVTGNSAKVDVSWEPNGPDPTRRARAATVDLAGYVYGWEAKSVQLRASGLFTVPELVVPEQRRNPEAERAARRAVREEQRRLEQERRAADAAARAAAAEARAAAQAEARGDAVTPPPPGTTPVEAAPVGEAPAETAPVEAVPADVTPSGNPPTSPSGTVPFEEIDPGSN